MSTRQHMESVLTGHRYQRNTLQVELDHFIQTHQDTTDVKDKLATLDAEIARLETELRNL
jgi:uncharacterized small protein (DUF1192 family)